MAFEADHDRADHAVSTAQIGIEVGDGQSVGIDGDLQGELGARVDPGPAQRAPLPRIDDAIVVTLLRRPDGHLGSAQWRNAGTVLAGGRAMMARPSLTSTGRCMSSG